MPKTESMIVLCSSCGTPGKAVIDTDTDEIVDRFFVCKCPRPPLRDERDEEPIILDDCMGG